MINLKGHNFTIYTNIKDLLLQGIFHKIWLNVYKFCWLFSSNNLIRERWYCEQLISEKLQVYFNHCKTPFTFKEKPKPLFRHKHVHSIPFRYSFSHFDVWFEFLSSPVTQRKRTVTTGKDKDNIVCGKFLRCHFFSTIVKCTLQSKDNLSIYTDINMCTLSHSIVLCSQSNAWFEPLSRPLTWKKRIVLSHGGLFHLGKEVEFSKAGELQT